jgi:hypothetical protein
VSGWRIFLISLQEWPSRDWEVPYASNPNKPWKVERHLLPERVLERRH